MSNHYSRARVASWFKWSAVFIVVVCVAVFAAVYVATRGVDAQQAAGRVNAVAFADANVGVAVGDNGFVRRTEDGGKTWTNIEANGNAPISEDANFNRGTKLNDVAFADRLNGIIVGKQEFTHGYDVTLVTNDAGKTWREAPVAEPRETINPDDLQSVSYPDVQHARAVGEAPIDKGVFIKTDDGRASFQRLPTNTEDVLHGVSFVDANVGWVVGENGTILHTKDGGNTFELQGDGEDKTRHRAVFFLDNQRGWIVGDGGDVHRTTNGGAVWEKLDVGVAANLKAVRFSDANSGYVLTDGGVVLNSKDGGATWQFVAVADFEAGAIARRADNAIVLVGQSSKSPIPALTTLVLQEGTAGNGVQTSNQSSPTAVDTATGAASVSSAARETKSIRQRVRETPVPLTERFIGIFGIAVLLGMMYLASNNRPGIEWRLVVVALGLQVLVALFILKTDIGFALFDRIGNLISALLGFSNEGAKFVFGRLVDPTYLEAVTPAGVNPQTIKDRFGFIFAFTISATIIFVASLFAVLYHAGIMQRVVFALAWVMKRTMRSISGAEALTVAAEIFMGQTEAPLTVAPYIPRMTRSELLAMMIGGMGTVSGGILAVYVGFGIDPVFLITTSVMAAPACLMCAKMLYPETEIPETAGNVQLRGERIDANFIDAIARGAGDGLRLALNVIAVLIAFIAMVAMVNAFLAWIGGILGINALLGGQPLGLQIIFGYLFAPLAFIMGVPWGDAFRVGDLLGTKLVLNELVAYVNLGQIQDGLQPRSVLIATFALCGFANISSVGIIIGGIGGLAPERRSDLARLGWRALFGGFIATCITATIAGILS